MGFSSLFLSPADELRSEPRLNNPKFEHRFGVQRATFKRMVKAVKTQIPALPTPGRPAKLSNRRPDFGGA